MPDHLATDESIFIKLKVPKTTNTQTEYMKGTPLTKKLYVNSIAD